MPDKLLPWILLFTAILFEVAGITSMKSLAGFPSRCPRSPSRSSMCSRRSPWLKLSTAYAIWSGVGTALAALIGTTYFREPLTLFKIASLVLVILGVLGLSLAARQTN